MSIIYLKFASLFILIICLFFCDHQYNSYLFADYFRVEELFKVLSNGKVLENFSIVKSLLSEDLRIPKKKKLIIIKNKVFVYFKLRYFQYFKKRDKL